MNALRAELQADRELRALGVEVRRLTQDYAELVVPEGCTEDVARAYARLVFGDGPWPTLPLEAP